MKIKVAVAICFAEVLLCRPLIAGGSSGGSGPPAKETLEQILKATELPGAGLFLNESGAIKLGVNRSLDSSLFVTRSSLQPQAFSISSADFDALLTSESRTIDAEMIGTPETAARSYRIEDSDRAGELILRDRREAVRSEVK
ncbi:hypothetical protein [Oligoflexus tunisiensis]|uniref:hypothetical protein n=1 Tax=Oligoflexus tunisiensis TaxID=708132 RepID=UPI00114CC996|nr:hypothetical protein [Oligoflexus tunisiensis]